MSAWVFNRADRFIPRLRVPDGNVALLARPLRARPGRALDWVLVSEAQPHTPAVQCSVDHRLL